MKKSRTKPPTELAIPKREQKFGRRTGRERRNTSRGAGKKEKRKKTKTTGNVASPRPTGKESDKVCASSQGIRGSFVLKKDGKGYQRNKIYLAEAEGGIESGERGAPRGS